MERKEKYFAPEMNELQVNLGIAIMSGTTNDIDGDILEDLVPIPIDWA